MAGEITNYLNSVATLISTDKLDVSKDLGAGNWESQSLDWSVLLTNIPTTTTVYNGDSALTGNRTISAGTNNFKITTTGDADLLNIDATNSRVGIGTSTPSALFSVHDKIAELNVPIAEFKGYLGQELLTLYAPGGTAYANSNAATYWTLGSNTNQPGTRLELHIAKTSSKNALHILNDSLENLLVVNGLGNSAFGGVVSASHQVKVYGNTLIAGTTGNALEVNGVDDLSGNFAAKFKSLSNDVLSVRNDGVLLLEPITGVQATALTPLEGMIAMVSSINGVFVSIGIWAYQNGAWKAL